MAKITKRIVLPALLIVGSLLLAAVAFTNASAAEPAKAKRHAPAKRAKGKAPSAADQSSGSAPSSPVGDRETALASCKKHVESMLKESAVTRFQGDSELKVDHPEATAFDISGWVTSQNNAGTVKRMDFACHAAHSSGGLWTTKTSLYMDK